MAVAFSVIFFETGALQEPLKSSQPTKKHPKILLLQHVAKNIFYIYRQNASKNFMEAANFKPLPFPV